MPRTTTDMAWAGFYRRPGPVATSAREAGERKPALAERFDEPQGGLAERHEEERTDHQHERVEPEVQTPVKRHAEHEHEGVVDEELAEVEPVRAPPDPGEHGR